MNKPNFFADIDVLKHLLGMDIDLSENDIELTVDITDFPYWLSFHSDEKERSVMVYPQKEFGYTREENEFLSAGRLQIDRESGEGTGGAHSQQIADSLGAFFEACRKLSALIQAKGLEPLYEDLDPEKAGILLAVKGGELNWKPVSGKDRPSLMVQSIFSPPHEARPYHDELLDQMTSGFMSLDEKVEAAEGGDADVMAELASIYLNGDVAYDVEPDSDKSLYWFRKAAEAGNSTAMYNLGLYYAKGYGIPRDFEEAARWMEKAAEAGDEDAPTLVTRYRVYAACIPKAERGDALAQAYLAEGLMEVALSLSQADPGDDLAECLKWAEKAYAQGNADACWTLGLAYENGRGVNEDTEKAVHYYQEGAKRGSAACSHCLGNLVLEGKYKQGDPDLGFKLIHEAAEAGFLDAMRSMQRYYRMVEHDEEESEKWAQKVEDASKWPFKENREAEIRELLSSK